MISYYPKFFYCTFNVLAKVFLMKVSKVIYFLFGGGVLAVVAILISFYQPNLVEEKEIVVPLVKEVIDAKPIEVKTSKKQNGETIKLEVIREILSGYLDEDKIY